MSSGASTCDSGLVSRLRSEDSGMRLTDSSENDAGAVAQAALEVRALTRLKPTIMMMMMMMMMGYPLLIVKLLCFASATMIISHLMI